MFLKRPISVRIFVKKVPPKIDALSLELMFFIEIIFGALLAVGALLVFRQMSPIAFKNFFAKTLVIAALIYVVFALVGWARNTGSFNWLLIEILGVGIYFLFALWGTRKSVLFLGLGWLLHIAWDVGLHMSEAVLFVPRFYPTICIGFDLVFGVYLLYHFFVKFRE